MCIKGFLKRFAPFFIALALGLFVASFFVSIALPNVRFNRGWRRHQEYHRRLEFENQRLREENQRLNQEIQLHQQLQQDKTISGKIDFDATRKISRIRIQNPNESINDLVPPPPPIPVRPAPYRK